MTQNLFFQGELSRKDEINTDLKVGNLLHTKHQKWHQPLEGEFEGSSPKKMLQILPKWWKNMILQESSRPLWGFWALFLVIGFFLPLIAGQVVGIISTTIPLHNNQDGSRQSLGRTRPMSAYYWDGISGPAEGPKCTTQGDNSKHLGVSF